MTYYVTIMLQKETDQFTTLKYSGHPEDGLYYYFGPVSGVEARRLLKEADNFIEGDEDTITVTAFR
jgi:hypothetical protein